jgi:aspartate/methionine/tyrosine aminotransferase
LWHHTRTVPRHPAIAGLTAEIRGSVFSALAHRLDGFPGETYPFHVGDTWLEPPPGTRLAELDRGAAHHRYAPPSGHPLFVDALVDRTSARTGLPIERAQVYPTAGATAGLFAVCRALLDPGEQVLVLAPYWPLIDGIVRACGAAPVAVPVYGNGDGGDTGDTESAGELIERLERHASPRTAALYLSSPNNPSGRVLPRSWVEAMTEWARRRDLWLLSDDVYESFVYADAGPAAEPPSHTEVMPLAPERTITTHSCSKAYAMAGHRCGWVVGPAGVLDAARKVGTHTFYSTPTGGQIAAVAALREGDPWLRAAARQYQAAGRVAASVLGLVQPQGGTFLFFDVAPALDDSGLFGLLEACADRGLLLAPGPSFGPYPTWVRLCFTAAPLEVTRRGVEVLRRILDERRAATALGSSPSPAAHGGRAT